MSLVATTAVLLADGAGSADRVHALAARLKCPVCPSESIADSPSQVARDLHELIEEQVAEGLSDDDIVAFFVATYGEQVLLDPPASGGNAVLWIAPLIVLFVGALLVARRRAGTARPITAMERARIESALDDKA